MEEQKVSVEDISQEITASLTAGVTFLSSGQLKRALAHFNLAAETASALGLTTPSVDSSGLDLSATERNRRSINDVHLLKLCAEVNYHRAVVLQQLGTYPESVRSYKVSINLYLRTGDSNHAAAGMTGLAECYQELGDVGNQIQSWESARYLYRESGDVFNEALVCVGMARTYLGTGQRNVCERYVREARDLCRKVHSKHSQGELQSQCGWIYSSMKHYKEALVCFGQALQSMHKDRRASASILQNIGAVYNEMGQFTEALDYHKQAAFLYDKLHKYSSESKCLCNLAFAQSQLHEYPSATKSYHQALTKAHSSHDKHLIFQASEGLGAIHYAMGLHSEAIGYFNEALTALGAIDTDTGLARERVMEKLSQVVEASRTGAKPAPTTLQSVTPREMNQEKFPPLPSTSGRGKEDGSKTKPLILSGKSEKLKRQDSVDAELTAYMDSYADAERLSSSDHEEAVDRTSPPPTPLYVREGSLALGPKTRELYTTVNITSDSSKVKTEIVSVADAQNHTSTIQQTRNTQTESRMCILL